MNKKILIGSIIAVAILIGVSFTSVVGYSSVKSDFKASPLFNFRTSRALDKKNKDLNFDYIGKGEESILSIPKRDKRIVMAQRIVDIIGKMDDATFGRFIYLIIGHLQKRNNYQEDDNNLFIQSLNQLRKNPDFLKAYISEEKKNKLCSVLCETYGLCITSDYEGTQKECLMLVVAILLIGIITVIQLPFILFITLILEILSRLTLYCNLQYS